jgi:hypothetical protein
MLHRIGTALVVLVGLTCGSPQAWAGTVGPEFRVNSRTVSDQSQPSVARLSNGGFVVTWTGQDGFAWGIYGQRYSAAGTKVGAEFPVNTYTEYFQTNPSVAALSNGGFVVTWTSGPGQDGPGYGVYGQRYSAAGARAGGEFRVNTHTANNQYGPSVAALGNGDFVVTWSSYGQDGASYGVYGQRYSAAGARAGNEFRVNTHTANDQTNPSVAALSNGGFVVTWDSENQDGSQSGVYGRRYSAAGARVGGEFRVNTYTTNDQNFPSVAGLSGGGFVVTWSSDGQDGSGYGVYGQRYSAAGAKVGAGFPVNTYTADYQHLPSVAGLSNGGFVVTWSSYGQDGYSYGVYGQRYSAAGAKVGAEFPVNTYKANYQYDPSVAALSNGSFVVTWTSEGQDGSSDGVYGQRFDP